jgi:GTP cyclohydrolase II
MTSQQRFESVYNELENSSDAEVQKAHDKFVRDEEYEIAAFILRYAKQRKIRLKPVG